MLLKKYESAYKLAKLLWRPKSGDLVYLIEPGKISKATVSRVLKNKKIKLQGKAHKKPQYDLLKQICVRPTPQDFEGIIQRLEGIFLYSVREYSILTVGLKVNKGQSMIRGRACKVLEEILALRLFDSRINEAVNKLLVVPDTRNTITFTMGNTVAKPESSHAN